VAAVVMTAVMIKTAATVASLVKVSTEKYGNFETSLNGFTLTDAGK
jgi:hypothetical protein